jgi:hypothetical protein
MYSITYEGFRSTSVDLDMAPSDCLQDCPGVVRGLIERRVAMDGAHTKQLDFWIVRAKKEGIGILEQR